VDVVPTWLPVETFVEIAARPDGVVPETAVRWAAALRTMDPTRDVALFLHSQPDAADHWSSRFVVVRDGRLPGDSPADGAPDSVFDQGEAFLEAHAACHPDHVEQHIWLPRGVDEARLTMTCACGGRVVIPCTRAEAQLLRARFRAGGFPVTTSDDPGGVH
jgi:hypothetical protein